MHKANTLFLKDLKQKYPYNFTNCRVLELGSLNINGSVRDFFENCEYTGIDKQKGIGVDIVGEIKDLKLDQMFDTLIAFNIFMHDLSWKDSISRSTEYLKKDGMFFICVGCEGNKPRFYPDWIDIKSNDFINHLEGCGFKILESFFEGKIYPQNSLANGNEKGMFNIVAQKI